MTTKRAQHLAAEVLKKALPYIHRGRAVIVIGDATKDQDTEFYSFRKMVPSELPQVGLIICGLQNKVLREICKAWEDSEDYAYSGNWNCGALTLYGKR